MSDPRGRAARITPNKKAGFAACIACALKSRCLQNEDSKNGRVLTIDEFEPQRERLRDRMKKESNQAQHARRQAAGERPFAVIKHGLGICGFLLRGTELHVHPLQPTVNPEPHQCHPQGDFRVLLRGG